jgi:hypothetical protein
MMSLPTSPRIASSGKRIAHVGPGYRRITAAMLSRCAEAMPSANFLQGACVTADESATTADDNLGWPLRGWLIFMILAQSWALYVYFETVDLVQHNHPTLDDDVWALHASGAIAAVNILAVIGIWQRRRAGAYIIAGTYPIELAIGLYMSFPIAIVYALPRFIVLMILAALLRPRWWLLH